MWYPGSGVVLIVSFPDFGHLSYFTIIVNIYVSPFSPCARLSICLPVCLSVCPSQKSCPLYNLITVRDISTKLHTFVKHIQTPCHAQEPKLLHVYFSSYSPCNMTKCIFCSLCQLSTVKAIWLELQTFLEHNETMRHVQDQ